MSVKLDFSDIPPGLGAKIAFNEEREEWLAVIFRKSGEMITVLSAGREETEDDAIQWARGTMRLMHETGRDDVELPDMYDRRHVH